jgi:DNA-binding GntR family transcriptional regulator
VLTAIEQRDEQAAHAAMAGLIIDVMALIAEAERKG